MPPQSSEGQAFFPSRQTAYFGFRVSGKNLLDHYFVCPAVAKIVFVNKGRLFVSRNVCQAKPPFVKPLLAGIVIA
jgi:hypothetical protein